jgi:hypothetical protein
MASKNELVSIIADLIRNGINMDNYNIFECDAFMEDLYNFINANTHLNAHYLNKKITIESVFFDPLLSVELDKTTIQCIPITDEGWLDAVFEVLKFMYIRSENVKEKELKQKKKQEEDNKELDWI